MKKKEDKKWVKLGLLISRERKNKDLRLREFAAQVGVSHVAISHIEKGRVKAKKDTLIKIAKALNYDKDTLLAKASKLDDVVENMLSEKSETAAVLFRSAARLTDDQLKKITKQIKKMSDENN